VGFYGDFRGFEVFLGPLFGCRIVICNIVTMRSTPHSKVLEQTKTVYRFIYFIFWLPFLKIKVKLSCVAKMQTDFSEKKRNGPKISVLFVQDDCMKYEVQLQWH
jgi:hypothetical protein